VLNTLLLVGCLLVGQAEASADKELAAKVGVLVRQLDSDTLAARVAAEKELTELGPAVLDLLPQITARTPAEVKQRLDRVRSTLEAAAVEAATKATLVTLDGEMTLAAAFAALEKQTGNKIIDFRPRFGQQPRAVNVKLSLQKVPFWQALDQVLDQAGMTVYNFGGEAGALAVVARPDDELPRAGRGSYSGLFRFEGAQIEAQRDLRNPANRSLRLTMEVSWEPRMTPIVLEQPLDQVSAMDENGNPLLIDGQQGKLEVAVQSNIASSNLILPLVLPDRSIKKIQSLSGTMTAMLPGRVETFQFADLAQAKNVEQKRAGVTIILEQVRKNLELYEVRVRVQFDKAANALESHRGWVYNNDAYLLDAAGQRVENAGLEATRQDINEVGLAYKFVLDNGLAGHTFVYKTPAAIVRMPVAYELKNIDLP
jgi:hypothetical protein